MQQPQYCWGRINSVCIKKQNNRKKFNNNNSGHSPCPGIIKLKRLRLSGLGQTFGDTRPFLKRDCDGKGTKTSKWTISNNHS